MSAGPEGSGGRPAGAVQVTIFGQAYLLRSDEEPAYLEELAALVCDGVEDDCDGETDEDYAPLAVSCGVGA